MEQTFYFNVRTHSYQDNSDSPRCTTWKIKAVDEDSAYSKVWERRDWCNYQAMHGMRKRYIGIISLSG